MQLSKEEIIQYLIGGTAFLLVVGFFIVSFIVIYNRRHRVFYFEQEALKTQFSQTLLQSQIEIQEQTRRHISRELHDNLGQIASIIKINLNTIAINDPEKAAEKIEDTKDLTRQLIADIKALSISLNSDRVAKTGLLNAIATEVERINKTEQFKANFTHTGGNPVIENDKAIILFRMVQEVLNNMVKHSKANKITITANSIENLFILALSDDGTGFSVEDKLSNEGQGLQNLQNRASLIHATCIIDSKPGTGTHITIKVPV